MRDSFSSAAFLVALTIPFSLLFALGLMYLTNIPIGLLSIGAIDFGIIADGAIIPQVFARLREQHDFQLVFAAIMVPCYLYILFYALRGCRAGLSRA